MVVQVAGTGGSNFGKMVGTDNQYKRLSERSD